MYVWNENVIMRKIASTAELNSTEPNKIEIEKKKKMEKLYHSIEYTHTAHQCQSKKKLEIFSTFSCAFFFCLLLAAFLLYFSNLVLILLFFVQFVSFLFYSSASSAS